MLGLLLVVPAGVGEESSSENHFAVRVQAKHRPKPEYPLQALRRRLTGFGVAVLEVNPDTGVVQNVYMETSTGHKLLDQATLNAFRRWEFVPPIPPRVKVPIHFGFGGRVEVQFNVKARDMSEVLAPFLGAGNVLSAPIPQYPRHLTWREKSGKGVYELHIGRAGTVSKVRVLRTSGDLTFDQVAVQTLSRWRLRRGPKIVELPLSFSLAPSSFKVDVAR